MLTTRLVYDQHRKKTRQFLWRSLRRAKTPAQLYQQDFLDFFFKNKQRFYNKGVLPILTYSYSCTCIFRAIAGTRSETQPGKCGPGNQQIQVSWGTYMFI